MTQTVLSLILVLTLCSFPSSAELYECDGVWTNRKCDSAPASVLDEKEYQPLLPAQQERLMRERWVNDLRSSIIKLERQGGTSIRDEDVRRTCLDSPQAPLEDCRLAIRDVEARIQQSLLEVTRQKEKGNQNSKVTATPGTIIVINNRQDDRRRWSHYHAWRRKQGRVHPIERHKNDNQTKEAIRAPKRVIRDRTIRFRVKP